MYTKRYKEVTPNARERGNKSNFYFRIPLETSRALAQKYGVENALSPVLDFIPGAYPVTALPFAPRKVVSSRKGSDEFPPVEKLVSKDGTITPPNKEISPIASSTLAERPPARSRVTSSATITQSPHRAPVITHASQEQTPKRVNEPIFLTSTFDEDQTQTQFLTSVQSRRNLETISPSDLNPGEVSNYEYTDNPIIKHISPEQRKKDILLHIFIAAKILPIYIFL